MDRADTIDNVDVQVAAPSGAPVELQLAPISMFDDRYVRVNGTTIFGTIAAAAAATVSALVLSISVAGYYDVGDGGGSLYKRVSAAPAHSGYFRSANGVFFEYVPIGNEINVKQFGAKCDGVTADQAAVNGVFDYLRNIVGDAFENPLILRTPFRVRIPGYCRVETSVNATQLRARGVQIVGPGILHGAVPNTKAVLDLSDSRWITVRDLIIFGDTVTVPKIGIQNCVGATRVSDLFRFENVCLAGMFTLTGYYGYGIESTTYVNFYCWNNNTASPATTYCAMFDGTNKAGVTSDFVTVNANTSTSYNDAHLIMADFRKVGGGPAVYLRRVTSLEMQAGYVACVNGPGIVCDFDAFGAPDLKLEVHVETTGVQSAIRFDGVNCTLRGFKFRDYSVYVTDNVFAIGTGPTLITLVDADIYIGGFTATPTGVFSDVTKFAFKGGKYFCQDETYMNVPTIFWGTLSSDTRTTIVAANYTVAGLPAGKAKGEQAFATNGRCTGQGGGAGTGVLCFWNGTIWVACDSGAQVAA